MAKYKQKGEVIDIVAESNLATGDVVSLTNCIGIAGDDIPSGKVGALYIEGVFEIDKTAELAISLGDKVYFNTTTKKITKTSTDVPAGIAVKPALASDTKVEVKLALITPPATTTTD